MITIVESSDLAELPVLSRRGLQIMCVTVVHQDADLQRQRLQTTMCGRVFEIAKGLAQQADILPVVTQSMRCLSARFSRLMCSLYFMK